VGSLNINTSREELLEQARLLRQQGDMVSAKNIYADLADIEPSDHQVRYFLGMTYWLIGDLDSAKDSIQKAIELGANEDTVFYNYGLLLQELKQPTAAVNAYSNALSLNPLLLDANNNLGLVLNEVGDTDKAIQAFQQELECHPKNISAMNNLANMFRVCEEFKKAEKLLKQALLVDSSFSEAHSNLGNLHWVQGNIEESLVEYKQAVELSSQTLIFKQKFCSALFRLKTFKLDVEHVKLVIDCFNTTGIDHQFLVTPTVNYLKNDSRMQSLNRILDSSEDKKFLNKLIETGGIELLTEPLAVSLLTKTIITDYSIEKLLLVLRSNYLQAVNTENFSFLDQQQRLLTSLSSQCFNNEYVYYVTEKENQQLEKAIQTLENELKQANVKLSDYVSSLLVIASYIPLYQLSFAAELVAWKDKLPKLLQEIITTQIVEVQQELELKKNLTPITEIDAASLEVQLINEEAPYPRWFNLNQNTTSGTYIKYFNREFPFAKSNISAEEKLNVLVAGCGTGKNSILVAQQFDNSDVLAVDISLSSLAYASRMSEKLGVNNIKYAQADILGLKNYSGTFHHIDCFGVLHHFQDPGKALEYLVAALLPGGTISLGLYSAMARQFIDKLRQFVKEGAYPESIEGVQRARRDIFEHQNNKELIAATKFDDFYTTSECRYLLFSAQDNCFTVPLVRIMLERCQLNFLAFIFNDKRVLVKYGQRFPEDTNKNSLSNWEIFESENPDTFKECYDFWCQKAL